MNILITGGAGFIGSHVVRRFVDQYPDYHIFNIDALTYAGNPDNIADLEGRANYTFIHGDIRDKQLLSSLFSVHNFDGVIHLAAESHVDRSISDPMAFLDTNLMGTVNLLEAARHSWPTQAKDKLFYHISTDEVYGSLGEEGYFKETTPYSPNSPYAASKAGSDHFVRAYGATYGLPYVISNCSNNYGPNQYPEKLIPLILNRIMEEKSLPIYGDGSNKRDWLYVEDHALAIDLVYHKGQPGQSYNIGSNCEWKNLDLVKLLCRLMDEKFGREEGSSANLITFVEDRPGHDHRYAIDATKIRSELGWKPLYTFEEGLKKTIDWYVENTTWVRRILTGEYREKPGKD
ncbi:dTDP-glucose 4,6-dehydratase [Zeaxanthinibacter enoshimensis]|uniref:dTDP-glucose 4,6-dehydratase n=1 Tax=Zeaxanthinibacter enoshimensis TaxID=392009 RepID=A0A4R6TSD4_9FLAO|nr:dTDP-glucose 4,6-dehydratase [Zeaxanthinibacter enoshimensis]TDQ32789.1 dTDP-glucose 4,6-dehydratase [Zeaxanthinibacter enoshimensis]